MRRLVAEFSQFMKDHVHFRRQHAAISQNFQAFELRILCRKLKVEIVEQMNSHVFAEQTQFRQCGVGVVIEVLLGELGVSGEFRPIFR